MKIRHLVENLEQYFIGLILEQRKGWFDRVMTVFLFICSRFYRMGSQFRLWMYDKRVIRNRAIGCLVVSIGNLSCGGTGKTPVVEVFAKTLHQKGRKVAVLSRGYRSKQRSLWFKLTHMFGKRKLEAPIKVVSDGKKLLLDSTYAGDEPYMLATNLKGVPVLVDKDRVRLGLYAIEHFQTDTLILDDGFQYLDLMSHINILLVDSTDPFCNHHVLPRGLLREPIKNIRRADYIFLTKSNGGNHLRHLKTFMRRHNRRAEIIECCHRPQYVEMVYDRGKRQNLEFMRGRKIAAISGIARPESFEAFLIEHGAEVVATSRFADHHRFTENELIKFRDLAIETGAEIIMTTEKDAVRMPLINGESPPFYFLRIEIDILSGQESFDQCISRICFL
ncbi:MAG: tetraacyldisaccharide 4'-kinase [Victivallaceae bacterium]|nr:tetraacyldisaccharide 4'-kinase [Victivallaceae bacterium]MDD4180688.1 tetraacyldisaccharide 4'-kinase [Victivallaceae bacterium]